MRLAVIGVGGVGGVLAAQVTRAGFDVTPVARDPAARDALAAHGYRVTDPEGTSWSVPVSRAPQATLPDALRDASLPFDAVIVTTQSPALEDALRSAAPALAPETIVIVCQNGLPEARARAVLPSTRVLGCVVGWGASMDAPGVYRRTSGGGLQLGDPDPAAPRPAGLEPLLRALDACGGATLCENFAGVRWSKLAINSVTSTVGAIGAQPLGRLLLHAAVRRLALEIFTELEAVARASGVHLAPVGGTLDISTVTLTPAQRRARVSLARLGKHLLLLAVGAKFRRMRSSMLSALERGRPPEIDHLNGEIVRRGEALGVPTPVNRALVERVREIEAGRERSSLEGLLSLARELGRA